MLKKAFEYWKGLLHGGYLDAFKSIGICIEAIQILEDNIRMPANPKSRIAIINWNKTRKKCLNLVFNARDTTQEALIRVYGSYIMKQQDLNLKSRKKRKKWVCYNEGIQMRKEASGCCEGVSGCAEGASGCVHLPTPETTNRTLKNCLKLILINTIWTKLGKNKSQWIKKQWYNN